MFGARHRIIHEASAHELSRIGVVDHRFEQRFADALRDRAVKLAFQRQRIDDGAHVIDSAEAEELDAAGFRIDFHFADHAAVGERVGTGMRAGAAQSDAQFLRQSNSGV